MVRAAEPGEGKVAEAGFAGDAAFYDEMRRKTIERQPSKARYLGSQFLGAQEGGYTSPAVTPTQRPSDPNPLPVTAMFSQWKAVSDYRRVKDALAAKFSDPQIGVAIERLIQQYPTVTPDLVASLAVSGQLDMDGALLDEIIQRDAASQDNDNWLWNAAKYVTRNVFVGAEDLYNVIPFYQIGRTVLNRDIGIGEAFNDSLQTTARYRANLARSGVGFDEGDGFMPSFEMSVQSPEFWANVKQMIEDNRFEGSPEEQLIAATNEAKLIDMQTNGVNAHALATQMWRSTHLHRTLDDGTVVEVPFSPGSAVALPFSTPGTAAYSVASRSFDAIARVTMEPIDVGFDIGLRQLGRANRIVSDTALTKDENIRSLIQSFMEEYDIKVYNDVIDPNQPGVKGRVNWGNIKNNVAELNLSLDEIGRGGMNGWVLESPDGTLLNKWNPDNDYGKGFIEAGYAPDEVNEALKRYGGTMGEFMFILEHELVHAEFQRLWFKEVVDADGKGALDMMQPTKKAPEELRRLIDEEAAMGDIQEVVAPYEQGLKSLAERYQTHTDRIKDLSEELKRPDVSADRRTIIKSSIAVSRKDLNRIIEESKALVAQFDTKLQDFVKVRKARTTFMETHATKRSVTNMMDGSWSAPDSYRQAKRRAGIIQTWRPWVNPEQFSEWLQKGSRIPGRKGHGQQVVDKLIRADTYEKVKKVLGRDFDHETMAKIANTDNGGQIVALMREAFSGPAIHRPKLGQFSDLMGRGLDAWQSTTVFPGGGIAAAGRRLSARAGAHAGHTVLTLTNPKENLELIAAAGKTIGLDPQEIDRIQMLAIRKQGTATGLQEVKNELLDATVAQAQKRGLREGEETQVLIDQWNSMERTNRIYWASNKGETIPFYFNGRKWVKDPDGTSVMITQQGAVTEAQFSSTSAIVPNVRQLRRLTSKQRQVWEWSKRWLPDSVWHDDQFLPLGLKSSMPMRVGDLSFGIWRDLALFRIGWALRILPEEHLRFSASGYSTMFNNPIDYFLSLKAGGQGLDFSLPGEVKTLREVVGEDGLGTAMLRAIDDNVKFDAERTSWITLAEAEDPRLYWAGMVRDFVMAHNDEVTRLVARMGAHDALLHLGATDAGDEIVRRIMIGASKDSGLGKLKDIDVLEGFVDSINVQIEQMVGGDGIVKNTDTGEWFDVMDRRVYAFSDRDAAAYPNMGVLRDKIKAQAATRDVELPAMSRMSREELENLAGDVYGYNIDKLEADNRIAAVSRRGDDDLRSLIAEGTLGGPITRDEFINRFDELDRRVQGAEKQSDPKDWTDAEKAAYERGDYEEFSRLRGYTEEEIADWRAQQEFLAGTQQGTVQTPDGKLQGGAIWDNYPEKRELFGPRDEINVSADMKFDEIRRLDGPLQQAFKDRGVVPRAKVAAPTDELVRPVNPKNGYQVTMDKFFEMFNARPSTAFSRSPHFTQAMGGHMVVIYAFATPGVRREMDVWMNMNPDARRMFERAKPRVFRDWQWKEMPDPALIDETALRAQEAHDEILAAIGDEGIHPDDIPPDPTEPPKDPTDPNSVGHMSAEPETYETIPLVGGGHITQRFFQKMDEVGLVRGHQKERITSTTMMGEPGVLEVNYPGLRFQGSPSFTNPFDQFWDDMRNWKGKFHDRLDEVIDEVNVSGHAVAPVSSFEEFTQEVQRLTIVRMEELQDELHAGFESRLDADLFDVGVGPQRHEKLEELADKILADDELAGISWETARDDWLKDLTDEYTRLEEIANDHDWMLTEEGKKAYSKEITDTIEGYPDADEMKRMAQELYDKHRGRSLGDAGRTPNVMGGFAAGLDRVFGYVRGQSTGPYGTGLARDGGALRPSVSVYLMEDFPPHMQRILNKMDLESTRALSTFGLEHMEELPDVWHDFVLDAVAGGNTAFTDRSPDQFVDYLTNRGVPFNDIVDYDKLQDFWDAVRHDAERIEISLEGVSPVAIFSEEQARAFRDMRVMFKSKESVGDAALYIDTFLERSDDLAIETKRANFDDLIARRDEAKSALDSVNEEAAVASLTDPTAEIDQAVVNSLEARLKELNAEVDAVRDPQIPESLRNINGNFTYSALQRIDDPEFLRVEQQRLIKEREKTLSSFNNLAESLGPDSMSLEEVQRAWASWFEDVAGYERMPDFEMTREVVNQEANMVFDRLDYLIADVMDRQSEVKLLRDQGRLSTLNVDEFNEMMNKKVRYWTLVEADVSPDFTLTPEQVEERLILGHELDELGVSTDLIYGDVMRNDEFRAEYAGLHVENEPWTQALMDEDGFLTEDGFKYVVDLPTAESYRRFMLDRYDDWIESVPNELLGTTEVRQAADELMDLDRKRFIDHIERIDQQIDSIRLKASLDLDADLRTLSDLERPVGDEIFRKHPEEIMTDDFMRRVDEIRASCPEKSLGACVEVSRKLADEFPELTYEHGSYGGSQHAWVEFEDGTILDTTADQFNGRERIEVVRRGDEQYSNYQRLGAFDKHIMDNLIPPWLLGNSGNPISFGSWNRSLPGHFEDWLTQDEYDVLTELFDDVKAWTDEAVDDAHQRTKDIDSRISRGEEVSDRDMWDLEPPFETLDDWDPNIHPNYSRDLNLPDDPRFVDPGFTEIITIMKQRASRRARSHSIAARKIDETDPESLFFGKQVKERADGVYTFDLDIGAVPFEKRQEAVQRVFGIENYQYNRAETNAQNPQGAWNRRMSAGHNSNDLRQLEVVLKAAKEQAINETKQLFYDLTQKSNIADATRLLFPFGDAWYEVLSRWAKIMNPMEAGSQPFRNVRRLQVGLAAARKSGFMSTNEYGEEVFNWPGLGALVPGLDGTPAGLHSQMPLSSLMFIDPTARGVLGPSMSPWAQLGARMAQPTLDTMPVLRDILNAVVYGGADEYQPGTIQNFGEAAEMFMPTPVRRMWAAALGDDNREVYGNTKMRLFESLIASGDPRFAPTDPAGMRRAWKVANESGTWLSVLRVFDSFLMPGQPQYQPELIKALDYEAPPGDVTLSMVQMANEYRHANNLWGRAEADLYMIERYGINPVVLQGMTDGRVERPSTWEAVNYYAANPWALDHSPFTAAALIPSDTETFSQRAWQNQSIERVMIDGVEGPTLRGDKNAYEILASIQRSQGYEMLRFQDAAYTKAVEKLRSQYGPNYASQMSYRIAKKRLDRIKRDNRATIMAQYPVVESANAGDIVGETTGTSGPQLLREISNVGTIGTDANFAYRKNVPAVADVAEQFTRWFTKLEEISLAQNDNTSTAIWWLRSETDKAVKLRELLAKDVDKLIANTADIQARDYAVWIAKRIIDPLLGDWEWINNEFAEQLDSYPTILSGGG